MFALIGAIVGLALGGSEALAQPGTNLALGAPVTMSSTAAGSAAANCVDGTAGDFCLTGVSGTNGIANQWVDVDLLGDHPIERIVLDNTGATCCRSTDRWLLIVSGDSSLPRPANPAAVYANARYYRLAYANGANGTTGAASSVNGGTAAGATWTTLTIPTGLRKAAWIRVFQLDNSGGTGNGQLGFNEIRVIQGAPFQRYLVNGGFETPGSGGALGVMRANGTTPGWSTTDQFNAFENWNRGPAGSAGPYDFPAFEGSTLIELNAWTSGTVSQSICVFPGESFQWSLAHHVRNPAPIGPTAPDVAKLTIDGADIAQFSDNSIRNATAASDHACTLLAGAAAASATCSSALAPPFTSDANGWGHWRGAWSNTNAVPKKVTFEVGAVTSASGSISAGNFLDAFDLAGLATVVTFSSASSSGPETIPGANLPVLTLSGVLAADSSVDIAFGGTAVLGQHYSTSTGTATVTVPIPAGTYDGTAATGIPLTPYLQILSDGPVHSPPDVLRMTLANFGAGIKLGNGQTCSPGSNPLDYTIFDIRPQLSLQKSTPTTTLVPNGTVTYTVTASNIGSVDGGGTVIADAVPAGISAFGWTCTASGGAACPNASGSGAISETVASFPAGGTLVYTIAATVAAVPPASLSNTATATLADADCAPGNSPSPCVATAVIAARPAIRIDKGTPDTVASPGGTVNYAVNLTNAGSAGVTAASPFTFSDALPAGVTAFGWTCQAFGGAVCPVASGSGAISATITTMPRGSRLTYSIQAAVAANPPASVVNTAQITAPAGGGTCAQNGNADPCADSVALPAAPKIRVNKTTSTTSLVAGGTVDYTVVVTNAGNVAANGTTVSDAIPAGLTTPFTWTCTAASGAACPNASGSGEIAETIATLPAGGSVSFAIAATVVSPAAPTLVTNTARATPPPGGVCAPANSAPPCTAAAALSPVPIMSLQKTASTAVLVPNANVVFTLLARNVSDRGADGTTIADAVPAGLAFTSWTCSGSGGATCTTASGSGAVNQVAAAFPPGGEIIHTIHATVSASPPASITNTASGTPANNGACFPNNTAPPCTSAVTLTRPPSVSITKTSSATAVVPNGTITYEIVVTNTGTSSAAGTLVNDPVPAGITSFAWTCAASGGAACAHASGSGGIGETALVFPAGGSLTYTVTAVTSANPPASITNTARATPPNQGTCSPSNTQPPCAASVSTPPVPVLDLQKTTSSAVLTPGGTVVYAITVGNAGFVPADGSVVSDPIPAGLTTPFTWTCSAANGAVCPNASGSGAIAETIATLPADGSLDYTVTATVAANPPALIDNVVTAQPPASGGLCAPDNAAPPCRANVQRPAAAIVQLHKSTTAAQATPGGTVTYSVVVTNPGNADAGGTTVSDPIPAGLTTPFTWTCTASGGAVCAAGGSGALNDTLPAFPAGATATYTITATVADAPPASVTNTAAATPAPGGVCAPGNTPPPCTSAATVPAAPTISVQKSTSDFFATPSGTLTYTVVVSNTGSVPADGTTVGDPLPAGLTAFDWTCTASGGAACTAAGSGALADTIAPFPPGSVATYTITAAVDAAPPAQITNTASATPVDGVCAPANTAPPCASTTTTPTVPRISVAKTANTDVLTPGGTVVYTVAVGNAGAVAATNVLVSDPMPAGIAAFDWTCAGTACPNPAGTGAISQTIAALPAGASVVYTVTATVGAAPPAQITNTVSVDPPDAVCAPGNTPPPCSSSVSTPPGPQVSVTKTADTTVLTPGGTVTYTIIVNNAGSVAAPNTVVGDPVPPGIATFDWTCASAGGAICPNASGSGAINETIATLPAAANVTYTVAASVSATPPEQITNTASASPPGGLCVPGNTPPPCSSSVSTPPGPQIRVTKTADTATLTPGGTINYTVTVTNTGSVAAPNTAVSDPVPAGITAFAWSCSAAGGAVCPAANGTGAVNAVIATLPAGGAVTYAIAASVDPDPPAVVVNSATASPPGGVCSPANTPPPCSSSASVPPVPQVEITKTANTTTITPGGSVAYTVTVRNTGSVAATGTTLADPIPAGLTAFAWTCASSAGALCPNASGSGALNETIATFPPGGWVVYTITATIAAAPPASVTNTASATPSGGGVCTPANTAAPCVAAVAVSPVPVIELDKRTTAATLDPGGTVTYTVTARNVSNQAAGGTTVADPIPAGLTTPFTWTCVATAGALCPNAAGSGAINETLATFPAGGNVMYTITATVDANPPASVSNTATSTTSGGLCVPDNAPSPCSSTATTPTSPRVSIAKTASATSLTPGGTVTYTIVVDNAGSVAAPNTHVSDPVPPGITAFAWTCAGTGGAICPNASGAGAIDETIATLPANARVTYTVTATVSATPPAQITNTATAAPPDGVCAPGNTPPPCSASASVPPGPQVRITKTADTTVLTPGGTVTYTIVVDNVGSVAAPNTHVTDPVPAGITAFAWTCAGTGGAICPNASGAGAIDETIATLPTNASVTYTVTAAVSATPPAQITNTATATPPDGVCAPANTPPPCSSAVGVPPLPELAVTKTLAPGPLVSGGTATYTIAVRNTSAVAATDLRISDPLPAGIVAFDWICTGAACPNTSGNRAIDETVDSLPAGDALTYTVSATLAAAAPAQVTNTVSVSLPGGGVCAPSTTAAPCQSSATGSVRPAAPAPASSPPALLLLALGVLMLGVGGVRRRIV